MARTFSTIIKHLTNAPRQVIEDEVKREILMRLQAGELSINARRLDSILEQYDRIIRAEGQTELLATVTNFALWLENINGYTMMHSPTYTEPHSLVDRLPYEHWTSFEKSGLIVILPGEGCTQQEMALKLAYIPTSAKIPIEVQIPVLWPFSTAAQFGQVVWVSETEVSVKTRFDGYIVMPLEELRVQASSASEEIRTHAQQP